VSQTDDYIEVTNDEPPAPAAEKAMGFWDHLEELRWTLVKCAITFVIFAGLIGYYIKEFDLYLKWPLWSVASEFPDLIIKLGTMSMMEVFSMIIQMCVMGGFLLATPFMLFFVGQFVAPALTVKEKRAVMPMCVSAFILFLIGAAFGFFLLMPSTVRLAIELNTSFDLEFRWTAGSYYSTLSWLVLGVGASFEFPLVVILLVWMGIMTTDFLRKYRRHAIVVIFIIAAIVTPTPDPIVQTLFATPLYLLYEIAILVSSRIEKRKRLGSI
jgi:sec-independent protein translocase protein TatC